ncbi:TPA: hydrogenase expression/formation protein HypE, partial [Candidatus Bathyarchaeota archaeon]|nr:hydrogenase expression/formation protein HypE [Candidatus Bathyarchaeota archaeon]
MDDVITLAHGAGGTVMGKLIKETILPSFFLRRALEGIGLDDLDDGASLKLRDHEIVVSLDSHTVSPLFFPGGDIGRLALAGTVNDVAVMGAKPIAVLDAVIVEEGFPISDLKRVLSSMNRAASEVPVAIIGG